LTCSIIYIKKIKKLIKNNKIIFKKNLKKKIMKRGGPIFGHKSAVDTYQTINIWTKNVTEVLKRFLPLNPCATYKTNEKSGTKFKKVESSDINKIFNPSFNVLIQGVVLLSIIVQSVYICYAENITFFLLSGR